MCIACIKYCNILFESSANLKVPQVLVKQHLFKMVNDATIGLLDL